MYTEQELTAVIAQKKKRLIALLIPVALLLIGTIYFIIMRNELAVDVLFILAGALLIAGLDLFVKPIHCYERHISNILHGMTHELDCEFGSFSEDVSEVDGVNYRTLTVVCYDEKNKPFDRIFYYDLQKPVPALIPAQPIRVLYHDRAVGALTAL